MRPQRYLTDTRRCAPRSEEHRRRRGHRSYTADREVVLKLLNDALATEIVCVLRYKRHYFMAKGIHSEAVAAEFLSTRRGTGTRRTIAERIVQLGGEPNFEPDSLKRARIRSTRRART